MLLEIKDLIKYYGERKIIELDAFKLSRCDKVAVVGSNGSGKTTLLNIISGSLSPDSGLITVKGSIGVVSQLDGEPGGEMDSQIAGRLGLDCQAFSGGEKVKERIARAFGSCADILLADEPTTNLDIKGITYLEELLCRFQGGLIIVSHDRALLKSVCNKVLEIDRGKCRLYSCGYADYLKQKELEMQANEDRYDEYIAERDRLKYVAAEKMRKSASVKKTPKRMGNSEARLHKMGGQGAKEKLDRAAKAAKSRLEQLESVDKPWKRKDIVFDVFPGAIHSPVLIRVNDISKEYSGRAVIEHCSFIVPNNKKTALIGDNGTGKTTLLEMIANGCGGIETCRNLKIGYFKQDMSNLDESKSVLVNAMEDSVYNQQFARTILARLLFKRDELGNSVSVLSGGERIKLSIAKIILSDFNLLMLDEPTNYLDIDSRKALESVLAAYPGAVLFVSHDREFIRSVADRVVLLKEKAAVVYEDPDNVLGQ